MDAAQFHRAGLARFSLLLRPCERKEGCQLLTRLLCRGEGPPEGRPS